MRDALNWRKVVVLFGALCLCAVVVVLIWLGMPQPKYRYERTKDPNTGAEHLWQIDEQTGQTSKVN